MSLDPDFWAYIATPLRAIADMIYLNRAVSWQNDGAGYLLESLRMEEEDLSGIPFDRCREITSAFRSRRVKEYLLGLQKEYQP